MTPSFQLNKLRTLSSRTATHQWQMFVFLPDDGRAKLHRFRPTERGALWKSQRNTKPNHDAGMEEKYCKWNMIGNPHVHEKRRANKTTCYYLSHIGMLSGGEFFH